VADRTELGLVYGSQQTVGVMAFEEVVERQEGVVSLALEEKGR